ncbi:MAG: hypothetical protein ACI8S6_001394 [Myxococcota bacterium]|jgi:hypothetical protein
MISFAATVRIDPEPSGKQLQAVWLERDSGTRWVVAYRPDSCWRAVEDQKMIVIGEVYPPPGQAISATHFRVDSLRAEELTPELTVAAMGAEQTVTGHLAETDAPRGRHKGVPDIVLLADDGRQWMFSGSPIAIEVGKPVTAIGRPISLSPYTVHRPPHRTGPRLCVREWVKR